MGAIYQAVELYYAMIVGTEYLVPKKNQRESSGLKEYGSLGEAKSRNVKHFQDTGKGD